MSIVSYALQPVRSAILHLSPTAPNQAPQGKTALVQYSQCMNLFHAEFLQQVNRLVPIAYFRCECLDFFSPEDGGAPHSCETDMTTNPFQAAPCYGDDYL